jgi:hypothetical protein
MIYMYVYAIQAVLELLDGEGAAWIKKKYGRDRDINAKATVEGNKVCMCACACACACVRACLWCIMINMYVLYIFE